MSSINYVEISTSQNIPKDCLEDIQFEEIEFSNKIGGLKSTRKHSLRGKKDEKTMSYANFYQTATVSKKKTRTLISIACRIMFNFLVFKMLNLMKPRSPTRLPVFKNYTMSWVSISTKYMNKPKLSSVTLKLPTAIQKL